MGFIMKLKGLKDHSTSCAVVNRLQVQEIPYRLQSRNNGCIVDIVQLEMQQAIPGIFIGFFIFASCV